MVIKKGGNWGFIYKLPGVKCYQVRSKLLVLELCCAGMIYIRMMSDILYCGLQTTL